MSDSKKYAKSCVPGGPAFLFQTEGLAIISKDIVAPAVKPIAYSLMEYTGVKANVDYLTNSMQKGGYKNHSGRKWQNIYPGEGRHDYKEDCARITEATLPLITLIEQCICPHDCYARNAAILRNEIKSCHERTTNIKYHELLTLRRINLLLRDQTLEDRQSLHIDGRYFGINAILVEKCGDDGYNFHYIPKSHTRINTHNECVWVPKSFVRHAIIQQGELVVFAPSLIHAGGRASSPKSTQVNGYGYKNYGDHYIPWGDTHREQRYRNIGGYDKWTDVSFQFMLSHAGNPMIEVGRGQNIWFMRDEQKHEDAEFQGQRYHKVDVNCLEFHSYIEEGGKMFVETMIDTSQTWLDILSGKAKHITRKRSNRKT
jgi:hypothetical protein